MEPGKGDNLAGTPAPTLTAQLLYNNIFIWDCQALFLFFPKLCLSRFVRYIRISVPALPAQKVLDRIFLYIYIKNMKKATYIFLPEELYFFLQQRKIDLQREGRPYTLTDQIANLVELERKRVEAAACSSER